MIASIPFSKVIHLGPCSMCGNPFKVDREWWCKRYDEGLPALEQCRACHALAHTGAPEPA